MASSRANRTPKKQALFLEALAKTGNVTQAAAAAETPRRTVYEWRDADEDFAKAWDEAMDEAGDHLEAEGRRRAVDGVVKPLVSMGKIVTEEKIEKDPKTGEEKTVRVPMMIREYSDTLLIFLLKGAKPEKYRETSRVLNLTVTPDELAKMTDEQLDALERQLTNPRSPRT